jgi:hypothetical protein
MNRKDKKYQVQFQPTVNEKNKDTSEEEKKIPENSHEDEDDNEHINVHHDSSPPVNAEEHPHSEHDYNEEENKFHNEEEVNKSHNEDHINKTVNEEDINFNKIKTITDNSHVSRKENQQMETSKINSEHRSEALINQQPEEEYKFDNLELDVEKGFLVDEKLFSGTANDNLEDPEVLKQLIEEVKLMHPRIKRSKIIFLFMHRKWCY